MTRSDFALRVVALVLGAVLVLAGLAFLPAVVAGEPDLSERAGVLLNALFVAADETADETLAYGQPSMRAMDEQGSVLYDLARCLQGRAS